MKAQALIALTLLAVAATLAWSLASASGDTVPATIFFEVNHQRPVAGHAFTGLVIADTAPGDQLVGNCGDVQIGKKRLPEEQSRFNDRANVVVCSWYVPKGTGGKRLHMFGSAGNGAGSRDLYWRVRR